MAWHLDIGGVDKTSLISQPKGASIELALSERGRANFTCFPGYVPARLTGTVLYAQDGTTPLFGGVILKRTMNGLIPGVVPAETPVECTSYLAYADWCSTTVTYTDPVALEDVLYDFTWGSGMSLGLYSIWYTKVTTGVTLAPFAWTNKKVSDALRELTDRTGYVFEITALKELLAFLPGDVSNPAPYTITDAAPHCEDFTWSDPDTPPANRVILSCGTGQGYSSEDQASDGSQTTYVTDYPASLNINDVWPNVLVLDGVPTSPVSWGSDPSFDWYWDAATHTLVNDSSTPLGAGVVVTLAYTIQYPFTVTATTGASPSIEHFASRADNLTLAQAQEIADGLLLQVNQSPREATIPTMDQGWLPGQRLTVNLTGRSITATCTITRVRIDLLTDGFWRYTLTAKESTVYSGSYLDQWRQITGGTGSAGDLVVSSVAPTANADPHWYNATRYGAKHDGATDDTPAIQAAVDAAAGAGGGTVFLPNGIYRLCSAVELKSFVRFLGESGGNTILKPYHASTHAPALTWDPDGTASALNVEVGYLSIQFANCRTGNDPSTHAEDIGVALPASSGGWPMFWHVHDVTVYWGYHGIKDESSLLLTYDHCWLHQCRNGVWKENGTVARFENVFVKGTRWGGGDLTVDASNDHKVTAASYAFVAADVGKTIYQQKQDATWTHGTYTINSVTGGAAILSASPAGTSSGSGWWRMNNGAVGDHGWYLANIQTCALTNCAMDEVRSDIPFHADTVYGLTIRSFYSEACGLIGSQTAEALFFLEDCYGYELSGLTPNEADLFCANAGRSMALGISHGTGTVQGCQLVNLFAIGGNGSSVSQAVEVQGAAPQCVLSGSKFDSPDTATASFAGTVYAVASIADAGSVVQISVARGGTGTQLDDHDTMCDITGATGVNNT